MGGLEIDPESRVLVPGNKPILVCSPMVRLRVVSTVVRIYTNVLCSDVLLVIVRPRIACSRTQVQRTRPKVRLSAVAGHLGALLSTTTTNDPTQSMVNLTFSWDGSSSSSSPAPAPSAPSFSPIPSSSTPASAAASEETSTKAAEAANAPSSSGPSTQEFTAEEVTKHDKKDVIRVIVDGQVLDVTKFLPDHPGGEKAILLYAGRDATEEFNMLHDPKVIPRYAPDAVIGKVKA